MKIKLFFYLASLIFIASCSHVNKFFNLEDDNLAEEILEEIIESQTNIEIDLTP